MIKKVLFVCVENAGRSQMAEAFAKLYGKGEIEASSAGTKPASRIHFLVVEAMMEKGIDISNSKPKLLTVKMLQEADTIVVMGCEAGEFCPAALLEKVVDWGLEDPRSKPLEKVREIRDEIERKVLSLISDKS